MVYIDMIETSQSSVASLEFSPGWGRVAASGIRSNHEKLATSSATNSHDTIIRRKPAKKLVFLGKAENLCTPPSNSNGLKSSEFFASPTALSFNKPYILLKSVWKDFMQASRFDQRTLW